MLVLNGLRISQFENEIQVVKGYLFGGKHLIFILHLIIYLEKRGETERTLRSHIMSPTRWQVNSRVFQEVEVPSGRIF
jgi:hypothetical protein